MNTKLTLTIEREIIEKAKQFAKKNKRSLSDLVENYLKALVVEDKKEKERELSPIVSSLKGAFKMPENFDYKEELSKQLEKKYLK